MIYEIAEIDVIPGKEADFQQAVATAVEQFKSAEGCHGLRLKKSIENPSQFRLIVTWETVDDHMITFRNSEGFQIWRGLVGEYFSSPPRVQHFEKVITGF